jgi:hypothetical protein
LVVKNESRVVSPKKNIATGARDTGVNRSRVSKYAKNTSGFLVAMRLAVGEKYKNWFSAPP